MRIHSIVSGIMFAAELAVGSGAVAGAVSGRTTDVAAAPAPAVAPASAGQMPARQVLVGQTSAPQPAVRFDESAHDLGDVREADGAVTHTFGFTNSGSRAVVVERVEVDCGCTAAEFSREPVRPGARGQVTVTFDPAGYFGRFAKGVTVYTSAGRMYLKLSGVVIPADSSVEEAYPFALAEGVRANVLHMPFGTIDEGGTRTRSIHIINNGDGPVVLAAESSSGDARVSVELPVSLVAGEKGLVTVTCDPAAHPTRHGNISERIVLSVNGTRSALSMSVSAVVIDGAER